MSSVSQDRGALPFGELRLDWTRDGLLDGRPLLVLAHGAGAPLTSAFLADTASGLSSRGLAVLRFHFPYMQRHVDEGRRRPPDAARVLLDAYAAALDFAAALPGRGALALGGKSMGGRMASMLLADGRAPDARAAVYLGYPLHPPGRTDRLRSEHLARVPVPQLFVSGTADPLARLDLLRAAVEACPEARLVTVDGGDHSLALRRRSFAESSGEWLDAVSGFVLRYAAA